jgi:hypothetical protein
VLSDSLHITTKTKEKKMIKKAMQSDFVTNIATDMGLSLDDISALIKGYERFSNSSNEQKKSLIKRVRKIIGE